MIKYLLLCNNFILMLMLSNQKKIKNRFLLNLQKSVLTLVFDFKSVTFIKQTKRNIFSSSTYFNKQNDQHNPKDLVNLVSEDVSTEIKKISFVSTEEKFQNLMKHGLGHYNPYTRRYSNVDYSN